MVLPLAKAAPLNLRAIRSSHLPMDQPDWLNHLQSTASRADRERAFRAFLHEWQVPIYRFARRMVDSHEAADEVTQETLIQVYKSIDSFRGDSAFSTWVFSIANRKALDFIRSTARRWKLFQRLPEDFNDHLRALEADAHFTGSEAELKLHAAIATLPPRQRQVFVMRYFEDLAYQEIAQITSLTEGALKASYHHAASKIRRHIFITD